MARVSLVLCSLLCSLVTLVRAQVPIPNRPDGYGLSGPASAPIVFEAFFDLLCPDSKESWPVMQQMMSHYADQLHFRLHTFPLPYHTWSFVANQAAHVVFQQTNNVSAVADWTTQVFINQNSFSNDATSKLTRLQVLNAFASLSESKSILPSSTMLAGLQDPNLDWDTRVSWKYACSRTLSGTPTFLINGVAVEGSPSWSLSDWQSVIDPLLAPTN